MSGDAVVSFVDYRQAVSNAKQIRKKCRFYDTIYPGGFYDPI